MADPILALSDGRPGHDSTTSGMLQALEQLTDAPVERLETRLRVKFLRPLLHGALAVVARLPVGRRAAARLALGLGYRGVWRWPDRAAAVASTGGDTLYANALMAIATGAPNLFHGTLRGVAPRHFTRIVTSRSAPDLHALPNAVVLETAPVPKQPLASRANDRFTVTVLVGGDGGGYRFREEDWRALADRILEIDLSGGRLLLTTSRRTGWAGESILADVTANCGNLGRAVFYGRAPENVMPEFLACADAFLVTPDSASMVTEAVLTGRPVVLSGPPPERPEPPHERLLEQLVRDRRIEMLTPGTPFPDRQALQARIVPIQVHPIDRLSAELRPIFGRAD